MAHRDELLHRFDLWMRSAGRADKTIQMRLVMARQVLDRWPDPCEPTDADLSEWLGGMRNRLTGEPLSPAARATYYSGVRAFFQWLTLIGVVRVDPTATPLFQRPRVGKGLPRPLSVTEERRVLLAARGNTRAWLLLALRAGLRAHEIAKIRGEDVTAESVYVKGKGGKESYLPTHPDIARLAEEYPARGWWFPSSEHDGHVSADSVSILVGRLFRACGIPKGSIHRARHTYATTLRRMGVDLFDIQDLMRHESVATTEIYAKGDLSKLRDAINMLGDAG